MRVLKDIRYGEWRECYFCGVQFQLRYRMRAKDVCPGCARQMKMEAEALEHEKGGQRNDTES